jgi:hypothetical protein
MPLKQGRCSMCENNSPCKLVGCGLGKLQGGRQLKGFFARYFYTSPTAFVTVDIPPVLIANGLAENSRRTIPSRP